MVIKKGEMDQNKNKNGGGGDADTIENTEELNTLTAAIKGGSGDDIIKGGKAGFDEMGVPGQDIAIYSKAESSYTIEFYNQKHEKKETYQSDGYMKVIDSDTSSTGEGSDELWGIEGIEFADGFVGFEKKEALIDLDGDGLPDAWESENNLAVNSNDASQDPDGDGFTNLQEYKNGTDPKVSDIAENSMVLSDLYT